MIVAGSARIKLREEDKEEATIKTTKTKAHLATTESSVIKSDSNNATGRCPSDLSNKVNPGDCSYLAKNLNDTHDAVASQPTDRLRPKTATNSVMKNSGDGRAAVYYDNLEAAIRDTSHLSDKPAAGAKHRKRGHSDKMATLTAENDLANYYYYSNDLGNLRHVIESASTTSSSSSSAASSYANLKF